MSFVEHCKKRWPTLLQDKIDGKSEWNPEQILNLFAWIQKDWMNIFGRNISEVEMDRCIKKFIPKFTKDNQKKALRYAQGRMNKTPMEMTKGRMIRRRGLSADYWNRADKEWEDTFDSWWDHIKMWYSYERYLVHTKRESIAKMVAEGDERHKYLAMAMDMIGEYIPFTEENLKWATRRMAMTYEERLREEEENNDEVDFDWLEEFLAD